jgi:hypothetical protein
MRVDGLRTRLSDEDLTSFGTEPISHQRKPTHLVVALADVSYKGASQEALAIV